VSDVQSRRGLWPRLTAVGRELENGVLGALLVATVGVVFAQVLFRYVIKQPLTWSVDVATYLLVWVAFWGFAVAVRDRVHVALLLFDERVGHTGRRIIAGAQLIGMAAFMVALLYGALDFVFFRTRGEHSPLGIPFWVGYSAAAAGAAVSLVHLADQMWALARGRLELATLEDAAEMRVP
jgi:TRAP-type C4-dicarboxylate transport system permease small subunit